MIRSFEKKILDDIHFVERFIDARNAYIKDNKSTYRLSKKDIDCILSETNYRFTKFKNEYMSDIDDGGLTFRLIFDIKDDSVLTTIYVLKNGVFLNNNLAHFGYLLNSFDLTGVNVKSNFGFNSSDDFFSYMRHMFSIFEDFRREFMLRGGQTLN